MRTFVNLSVAILRYKITQEGLVQIYLQHGLSVAQSEKLLLD